MAPTLSATSQAAETLPTSAPVEDDILLHPARRTVVVKNVEPTLDAGADRTVDEGSPINLGDLMISDLGTNDTHTIAVDWDDVTQQRRVRRRFV